MAYSAAGANNVSITVNNLTSKPYIDLTLKVMKDFGLNIPQHTDYKTFLFTTNAHQSFEKTIHYTVEGDWSGGAFLLVAGAIAGNITVKGLALESTQADKKIMEALKACNANMEIKNDAIIFSSSIFSACAFYF